MAHEALEEKGLLPSEHHLDAYLLVRVTVEYGVGVVDCRSHGRD